MLCAGKHDRQCPVTVLRQLSVWWGGSVRGSITGQRMQQQERQPHQRCYWGHVSQRTEDSLCLGKQEGLKGTAEMMEQCLILQWPRGSHLLLLGGKALQIALSWVKSQTLLAIKHSPFLSLCLMGANKPLPKAECLQNLHLPMFLP